MSKHSAAAAAAKSPQLCPTLCNSIDGSLPGSSVPGIIQARTLEWVAISFSNAWKWKVKVKFLRLVRLFGTPGTAAYQAPPSMGFSRHSTCLVKKSYILLLLLSRFSHVHILVTLWIVVCQSPLSMGFSRQEYWSGLPCPPSKDLPNPRITHASLVSPELADRFFTTSATWKDPISWVNMR